MDNMYVTCRVSGVKSSIWIWSVTDHPDKHLVGWWPDFSRKPTAARAHQRLCTEIRCLVYLRGHQSINQCFIFSVEQNVTEYNECKNTNVKVFNKC